MPSTIILKAVGLNISPNEMSRPEGSLNEADNVIIRRDGVIEPRRGFKLYGESFGTLTDRVKQLFSYRQRILRHYSNILQFENGVNNDGSINFDDFSGNFTEAQSGLRIKSIESNGNLYFTTNEGIKKISAADGSDLSTASGYITQAGGIKALDINTRLDVTLGDQTDFFLQDSAVAYRVVWGTKDINNNLILGTPSQRSEIFNPMLSLMIKDFLRLLVALDDLNQTDSLITDGNYFTTLQLFENSSASDLRSNLIALTTKLDNDIEITEGTIDTATAEVTNTTDLSLVFNNDVSTYILVNDRLVLSGFSSGGLTQLNGREFNVTSVSTTTVNATLVGTPVLTNTGPTADTGGIVKRDKYALITQPVTLTTPTTHDELASIQTYLDDIIVTLQEEPIGIFSLALSNEFIQPLDITTTARVIIEITIPEEVTSNDFYQVYRSSLITATGVAVLSDLVPNDEMQLAFEAFPTTSELSARKVLVDDITPDQFLGANLYTNEASGEGIAQANDLPPFALDINRFKNYIFFANTRTRHRQLINLLGIANLTRNYATGLNTNTFTSLDVDTSTDTITISTHGYTEGQAVYFTNPTPSNLPGGITQSVIYHIKNATTNTFQLSLTAGGTPIDLTTGGTGTHTVQNSLPKFTITNGSITNTYSFINGIAEVTELTCVSGATLASSGTASYFFLNSANDDRQYYVWYKVGTAVDPLISDKIGIEIFALTTDTNAEVADRTRDGLNAIIDDFSCTSGSPNPENVTITNTVVGYTTDASNGNIGAPFSISILTQGIGESVTNKEILLSNSPSPAISVDETSRSLVRIINRTMNESIYAFYLSTSISVPGQLFLESRTLNNTPFYMLGNSNDVGLSFNPDISPSQDAISISAANPTVITTPSPHGMTNGDSVIISGSDSTPSVDGLWPITFINTTSFSIPVHVTVAGNFAAIIPSSDSVVSQNEVKQNRIYYSKLQQPEAVPIANFLDVGAENKAILRIFPLRDSLFVYKEDGLFRISGQTAPFNLALFDSSTILLAPDSVAVSNNIVYSWCTLGITTTSESGVNIVSRPIDTEILRLASSQFTNFKTATWGLGYDSDNSYIVWSVVNTIDTQGEVAYRYSNLTHSWTKFDKTNTCGIVDPVDDKLILGAGDTNFIEKERKDFSRYDYADRELPSELTTSRYFGNRIQLSSVTGFSIGDSVVQDQTLTIYDFNILLEKLDSDPGLADIDYVSTLTAIGGDDMRAKLVLLAAKLDADPGIVSPVYSSEIGTKTGTITAISVATSTNITSVAHGLVNNRIVNITGSDSIPSINGKFKITFIDANNFSIPIDVTMSGTTGSFNTVDSDFNDMMACFNQIAISLNADTGVAFSNYRQIDHNTIQEALVINVDPISKSLTLNLILPYIVGEFIVFKAIPSSFLYSPITMGDPLGLKHLREATVMFLNKAFTGATLSFATDLLPKFNDVPFNASGNGIFGHFNFGEGFFGGSSNSIPFRTYVPRDNQRCRYLLLKFSHTNARESYSIFGMTVTGEVFLSSRAYR